MMKIRAIDMNKWKKILYVMGLGSLLFLTGCKENETSVYQYYIKESIYQKEQLDLAHHIQVMNYKMPSVTGELVTASALVLTPQHSVPQGGWRVVVWGHGTVGNGDSCAPSQNRLNPNFKILAEQLLGAGYVIVAPDYEGLGVTGIHPYLHLESAAQSMIYAMKAYQERYGDHVNGAWMSVGQSQGGHASLATAEYAQDDPYYLGAVAAAPASGLGHIIQEVAPQVLQDVLMAEHMNILPYGSAATGYAELLAYTAYVTTGMQSYQPDFDYHQAFEPRSQPIVDAAKGTTGDNGLCLAELSPQFTQDILSFVAENPGKTVLDYPALIPDFDKIPDISDFLMLNQPATKAISKPIMIVQGTLDMAVPYQVTAALAHNLIELGTDVTLHLVEGATHTEAIVQKNEDVIAFIQAHMPIN